MVMNGRMAMDGWKDMYGRIDRCMDMDGYGWINGWMDE
jgi:hypothetical protein